ncbi:MAG: DUF4167 domain-containing protein [Pseudomonadota bacterium]|nr:DUF4167 domain-containing protein [Pseudomonadota bacterium]
MPNRSDGNRQDNRQRGNAAQLLEKYKAMARDAQLAGDRVQTEYFLQFADHYFRVLEDGRSRFEDQQSQRRGRDDRDDEDDDGDEMSGVDGDGDIEDDGDDDQRPPIRRDRNQNRDRSDQDQRPQRGSQDQRPERVQRNNQDSRQQRSDQDDRPQRAERPESGERPERPRRERTAAAPAEAVDERISLGVLPPAIGVGAGDGEVETARPRRRVRKPVVSDDGEEIAPTT